MAAQNDDNGGSELKEQFHKYCRFGNPTKTTMTTSSCNKLLRETKVTSGAGAKYSSADVDIAFTKVKQKAQKEINFDEFKSLLDELSKNGKMTPEQLSNRITKGKGPSTDGTTKVSKIGGVDHLTDSSKYGGTHKQRFDESGKGKGIDGREYRVQNTGYVTGSKVDDGFEHKVEMKK